MTSLIRGDPLAITGCIKYFKDNIVGLKMSTTVFFAGARESEERHMTRRSSFRAVKPYEVAADDEKMIKLDSSAAPAVVPPVAQPVLIPDEERRNRRRGSQL